jgi:hypothetical protein
MNFAWRAAHSPVYFCCSTTTEWRPLHLLLEQAARLVRSNGALELMKYSHVLDANADNLAVARADGTPMPDGVEPFAPLKKRVLALEAFAHDTLGDDAHESLRQSVVAICNHYRSFVKMVCDFNESNPPQAYAELVVIVNGRVVEHAAAASPTLSTA